jgi:hypothetical protein
MAEFWVCVRGNLSEQQVTTLAAAGVAVDDLRRISGGYGDEWQTLRTCVHASAMDDSEAKEEIAKALSLDATELAAYSTEIFR